MPTVAVVGGGLAGLCAAVALADNGFRVSLFEKRPRLGGRATSYVLPDGRNIDNCQHVTLGCCTNLDDFYRRVGVAGKIGYYDRLVFVDSKGRRGIIARSALPAPFHLAPSFVTLPLLDWTDKRAIARAMLAIVRNAGAPADCAPTSMLDWLKLHQQTPRAIERFWRVVLVSALNEELDRTDAAYGLAVFWKAFLSNARGFEVGIPAVPLAELYESSGGRIALNGGSVRMRCGVSEFHVLDGAISAIRLDDGAEVTADYTIAAIPFDRLLKALPEAVQQDEAFGNLRNLRVSPITSVHFWFDRPVMTEPFLTLVGRTTQWIYKKSVLCLGEGERPGQYLQFVISASRALAEHSQQEITDLCKSELWQVLPAAAQAHVVRSVVVRESAATFSAEPGCDRWRPSQRTSIRNLFLAGDWTQTGWPATMEGAVRSGYLAAEAILATAGRPRGLLQPELPVGRVAQWLSR